MEMAEERGAGARKESLGPGEGERKCGRRRPTGMVLDCRIQPISLNLKEAAGPPCALERGSVNHISTSLTASDRLRHRLGHLAPRQLPTRA